MLVHLSIRDLAIIESADLDLGPGMNVLTGETGAGKSIVLGALELVLGDRARPDAIRRGAKEAEVQALFRVPAGGVAAERLRARDLLERAGSRGAADDDGTLDLVIRRIVARTGRGKAWVNGVLVNVGTLAEVTRDLVDIASQHEHTALLDAETHLGLLDRFGGHEAERRAWDEAWTELGLARRAREELRAREDGRLAREDYLRFQEEEILRIAPKPGEDEALQKERDRLAHAGTLVEGARKAEEELSGRDGSVHDVLRGAVRSLDRLAAVDPELQPFARRLEEARIEVEDVAFEMRRYADRVDVDPRRLDVVEERLEALRRLKRKHMTDLAGLVEYAREIRRELEGFESLETALRAAESDVARLEERALGRAAALSEARGRAARALEALVAEELSRLAMGGARIRFELVRPEAPAAADLGPEGLDRGRILIETNAGEGEKPLHKVASGGELSRLLLALKAVLARADEIGTSVFDEVDSGVGGAVAEAVGRKLRSLAAERQVVVITHLPQIAALADHHLVVEKTARGERTVTTVRPLPSPEARAGEVARMLGGLEITRATRDHAEELIQRGSPDRASKEPAPAQAAAS